MSRSLQHSRRVFLKKSLAATALSGAVPYFAWNSKTFANASANDRPRLGCIGVGDMAINNDCPQHAEFADIVAVCDVDAKHAEQARNDPKIGKGKADSYRDYRKILDRADIDAVSIVTVDHWHVKIAIEAMEAGKHVFCQKPLTLTLEENQLIRNARRKYPDKAFLVGTQQRSDVERFGRAVNMVQKGLLGDIRKITVGIGASKVGGPFAKCAPPKELDWDMWLGQCAKVDYIKKRCHYDFRWWYEYSGGKFTDWGAHHIDIATWAIGYDKPGMGPIEIDGADAKHPVPFKDGYPTIDDCYNAAHDFSIKCKYPNGIEMIVDSRSPNGILFEGAKGRIFVSRSRISGKPIEENWDAGKYEIADMTRLLNGETPIINPNLMGREHGEDEPQDKHIIDNMVRHKVNFYRCIREGARPISDVETHVQMLNTCHLCTIAARLNRVIHWDPKAERIVGDDQAAAFFAYPRRPEYEIPHIKAS